MAVYRLGATIPSPGVSYPNIQECLEQVQRGENSSVYSLINLFSGGALLQLSIFALGIMPYITASIIVQLLTVVIPRFEQLKKEGQSGQNKLTQYTRYLTIALAVLQATGIVALADRGQLFPTARCRSSRDSSVFNLLVIVIVMTAGTAVIMWLGELVTERGIGNGMSLLIFTSIAARIPAEGAQHPAATAASSSPSSASSAWPSSPASCSSSRASGGSRCSTPSGWSAAGCTAARPPTCR